MDIDSGFIEVYHAGTDIIKVPDCKAGRKNLDFGQGFYVTDIYDQALNFARVKSEDRKTPGIINIYLLDKASLLIEAKSLIFDKYDDAWLDFIVACRAGKDIWKDYDYVEGGVADDRVINTVNLYIQGYIPKEQALKRLRYLKPNNQICIINQNLIERHLRFTDSLKIPE
jgi:hypothetical protein